MNLKVGDRVYSNRFNQKGVVTSVNRHTGEPYPVTIKFQTSSITTTLNGRRWLDENPSIVILPVINLGI